MTERGDDRAVAERPRHAWVYGNDHSPWVQAVLLGLCERGIPHTLVTLPPLSVFLDSGVMMPAVKFDDGPWLLDSERILVELGFSELDQDTRRAMQEVFASGAMRRLDDGWEFWRRFSLVRDDHPVAPRRMWNHFWRAFSMFYFSILIRLGRRSRPEQEAEALSREFAFFQERLAPGEAFLGGSEPDTMDFQLFGVVQMCASIPGRSLEVLRDEPSLKRLREWIAAMQGHFSEYAHLYTAREFEPTLPAMEPNSAAERFFYWSGAVFMWIAFPITLPMVFLLATRVTKKRLREPRLGRRVAT